MHKVCEKPKRRAICCRKQVARYVKAMVSKFTVYMVDQVRAMYGVPISLRSTLHNMTDREERQRMWTRYIIL